MWTRATDVPFSWLPLLLWPARRPRHLLGVPFGHGAWELWQGTSDCRVGSRTGNVCVDASVILVELAFGRLTRLLRIIAEQGTQPVRFEARHYGVAK